MGRETRRRVLTVSSTARRRRASSWASPTSPRPASTLRLDLGDSGRTVRLAFAGRHHADERPGGGGVGLAAGFAPTDIVGGLEPRVPSAGRGVWREAGAVARSRRHVQRQPGFGEGCARPPLPLSRASRRLVVLGDMLEPGPSPRPPTARPAGEIAASGRRRARSAMGTLVRLAVESAQAAGPRREPHAPTFEDTVAPSSSG